MLRDIHDIEDARIAADVCIVGSGAAGLTLAHELNRTGLRVALLEGGGSRFDERAQHLYRSDVVGLAHGGIHSMRFRVFGGSTTRWAGQALPLFDVDFERRHWVYSSGWPLTPGALDSYYERAARIMGIPTFSRRAMHEWPDVLPPPPAFDADLLVPYFSEFGAQPNFASTYGVEACGSPNIDVIFGANLTELVTDTAATEVQTARVRSFRGRTLDVQADLFVLCAGGIETARILLASDRYSEGGLGNATDLVGRYFQDHPGLIVGKITAANSDVLSDTFRPRKAGGIKFQPLFALSDQLQREEQLLNSNGSVLFHLSQRPSIAAGQLLFRSLRRGAFGADVSAAARTVLRDPLPVFRAARRHFVLKEPALDPSAVAQLALGSEQMPNPESRVFLSDRVDELGMRRAALDWRLTEGEIRAFRRSAEVVAGEFARLGLGSVDLDDFAIPDDPALLSGRVVDAGHHMGTTRMSDSSDSGVVDSQCRVYGLDNLYIGSSSVFPTSGTSNPTFTIIALALRIADTIKGRAGRSPHALSR